jgi:hypothetical protein
MRRRSPRFKGSCDEETRVAQCAAVFRDSLSLLDSRRLERGIAQLLPGRFGACGFVGTRFALNTKNFSGNPLKR